MTTLPLHDRVVVPVKFGPRPAYKFPHEVLSDCALSTPEKRAILADWASDANTVQSFPTLRRLPGALYPVALSSIMDALARLDDDESPHDDPPPRPLLQRSVNKNRMAA